jgi:hypothetical protein
LLQKWVVKKVGEWSYNMEDLPRVDIRHFRLHTLLTAAIAMILVNSDSDNKCDYDKKGNDSRLQESEERRGYKPV